MNNPESCNIIYDRHNFCGLEDNFHFHAIFADPTQPWLMWSVCLLFCLLWLKASAFTTWPSSYVLYQPRYDHDSLFHFSQHLVFKNIYSLHSRQRSLWFTFSRSRKMLSTLSSSSLSSGAFHYHDHYYHNYQHCHLFLYLQLMFTIAIAIAITIIIIANQTI